MSKPGWIGIARKPPAKIDPLLEPLLQLPGNDQADKYLSHLITSHAEPVIKRIVRYKLHLSHATQQADADDVLQEAILQLIAELQKFRKQPEEHPVSDVCGLAAVIAHRTCSLWMRREFPERHGLKNRLYYLAKHQNGLCLWQSERKKLIVGFAAWRGQKEVATEEQLKQLSENASLVAQVRWLVMGRQQPGGKKLNETNKAVESEPGAVLAAILNRVGLPIEFDKLIGTLTVLLPMGRQPELTVEKGMEAAACTAPDTAWRLEKRIFLQRLWEEIRRLTFAQRTALLLNLRDAKGADCIALFPLTGVASFRQLAETLGMTAERLTELWNQLPLEDMRIAELLQTTRQKVINARKSARERLARRLRGFI